MKKTVMICLTLAIAMMMIAGCSSCKTEKKEGCAEAKGLVPEYTIGADRQALFLRSPKDAEIHWMQTGITLSASLTDASAAEATVVEVTNGFQTEMAAPDGKGVNTKVTLVTTNTTQTDSLTINGSFLLDNYPLDDKNVKLSFSEALEKAIEANCPKPQTRVCVLRSPVGSRHVEDAYYIFGNGNGPMLFVNARTGDVTTFNPAFVQCK